MDAFDEHVLCDHQAAVENGALRVLAGDEAPALELREKPELTQL
jgi:hypothetical protein